MSSKNEILFNIKWWFKNNGLPWTDALINDLKKYMDWFRLADKEFESAKPLYPWYAWHRGERFEAPDRVKGMAFAVIPFCWIVKFSGITRFLYQFWKISPKYCGRKEKDHNILWSKWYSRREYFGLRPRADCVGTNRRALRGRSSPIEIPKARPCLRKGRAFGIMYFCMGVIWV